VAVVTTRAGQSIRLEFLLALDMTRGSASGSVVGTPGTGA